MRILQVVTYISPDGAYGGPVRVAVNQAKALTDLGHDVVIAAAAGGFDGPLPEEFDGFPVHLFPARRLLPKSGFAGLTSPALLNWLKQTIRDADVIHVHLARDLVALPSAALTLLLGKPLIVQTHGMVDPSHNWLAKPLDMFLTKPTLRRAKTVLYLTDKERNDLIAVGGPNLTLSPLINVVEVPSDPAVEQEMGPSPEPEILFLARLHVRKRPNFVVQAAKELTQRWPHVRFALVGPDEGAAGDVCASIEALNFTVPARWYGPIPPDQTTERLRNASIYVLPSINEPFPMSVLEAMALGLPVVITDTCGLAPMVEKYGAGIVCEASQESFDSALEHLVRNPSMRISMGAKGRRAIIKHYALPSIGVDLAKLYTSAAISGAPRRCLPSISNS